MNKEIEIPEGYEAIIEENKVIIKPKESEDERIRKELIKGFQHYDKESKWGEFTTTEILSWLEKKGEQTSADKVEPKFKVGDWITNGIDFTFQVCSIEDNMYLRSDDYLIDIETADKTFRLWTIQDAKDGDMLANEEMIVIFKHFEEPSYRQHIVAYIGLDTSGNIQITDETWTLGIDKAKPATKEQRDLLFQKMKEAGYEWDDEKNELKKIEQSCYHNDGLYYAKEILEKTFGKVEGYQSDDGKMEHQAAIETVNALYHKKSAWSEEDEDGGIEETEDDVTI